jgi:hypothetical protein
MRSREPLSHSSVNSLAICAAGTCYSSYRSAAVAHGLVPTRHTRAATRPTSSCRHVRKLQLIPEHTPISLALPSELRSSSAFRHVFRGQPRWRRAFIADRSET